MAESENQHAEPDEGEEEVDPRIQYELERLNTASLEINKLETEIDRARNKFRLMLADSTTKMNAMFKKLGKCVPKARPYYEAVKTSRAFQAEAQHAVIKFQRANSMYKAAKETVEIAEEKMMETNGEGKRVFDSAWQEMLNHATMKFMDAEKEKTKSEQEHMKSANQCASIQLKIKMMEKDMPRSISRSRPYFDLKDILHRRLEEEKQTIEDLQRALSFKKDQYKDALHCLEKISEEVHEKRKQQTGFELPPRTPGVGAESLSDAGSDLPSINFDDGCSVAASDFSEDIEEDDLSLKDLNLDSESLGERPERFGDGDGRSICSSASGSCLSPQGVDNIEHKLLENKQLDNVKTDSKDNRVQTNNTKPADLQNLTSGKREELEADGESTKASMSDLRDVEEKDITAMLPSKPGIELGAEAKAKSKTL